MLAKCWRVASWRSEREDRVREALSPDVSVVSETGRVYLSLTQRQSQVEWSCIMCYFYVLHVLLINISKGPSRYACLGIEWWGGGVYINVIGHVPSGTITHGGSKL